MSDTRSPVYYEIRVEGVLDIHWSTWFEGMRVSSSDEDLGPNGRGQTRIFGPIDDQAALHGVLAKVRDLGLILIDVRRIDQAGI